MNAKRALDLACVVPGLVVVAPVMALVALAIKLDSPGPVLFRQERMGKGGKPFRMYKFRSMVVDADKRGALITAGQDQRITRVGKVLRDLKLDELPQLFNVLRGEMSLVGPRPEVQRYTDLYSPEQRRVLDLTPGITDPASIEYRDESALLGTFADPEHAYVTRIMPHKVQLNLAYAERASALSDVGVIVKTLARIVRR